MVIGAFMFLLLAFQPPSGALLSLAVVNECKQVKIGLKYIRDGYNMTKVFKKVYIKNN